MQMSISMVGYLVSLCHKLDHIRIFLSPYSTMKKVACVVLVKDIQNIWNIAGSGTIKGDGTFFFHLSQPIGISSCMNRCLSQVSWVRNVLKTIKNSAAMITITAVRLLLLINITFMKIRHPSYSIEFFLYTTVYS